MHAVCQLSEGRNDFFLYSSVKKNVFGSLVWRCTIFKSCVLYFTYAFY